MLPCRTNQDCVSDPRQLLKSDLFAVSSSLDFYWFSVSELEKEEDDIEEPGDGAEDDGDKEDGQAKLKIESLAVFKKKDLGAELRQLDCCE